MKFIVLLLVILAFFYAFYSGAMAVWSYFQMSDVVDQAFQDAGKLGGKAVRDAVLKGAVAAGVPVEDRDVVVSDDSRVIAVRVQWTWPVVRYKGEQVVAIPLSIDRSFTRP